MVGSIVLCMCRQYRSHADWAIRILWSKQKSLPLRLRSRAIWVQGADERYGGVACSPSPAQITSYPALANARSVATSRNLLSSTRSTFMTALCLRVVVSRAVEPIRGNGLGPLTNLATPEEQLQSAFRCTRSVDPSQ